MAAGWEIQEEEARVEIPITHGIRFQSNDPCVCFPPYPSQSLGQIQIIELPDGYR
jgi:hypothetical protein